MKRIHWIILAGLLIRIAFMIWGAPVYYGKAEYATFGGDTWAWVDCMKNLIHTGTYTADPDYPDGKFYRPPGYALFLGVFYILTGFDLKTAFTITQIVQLILDTLSIYLFFRITQNITSNPKLPVLAALAYSVYPFSIVWTPVLYAETPGLFFLFSGILLMLRSKTGREMILSGICLGIAVLLRVQIAFMMPAVLIYLIQKNGGLKAVMRSPALYLLLAFGVTYGSWPLRNLTYGKFIPAEEIINDKHFSEDFFAFAFYIWSVKTDHRPQFDQIIHGETVNWPKASYLTPGDSSKLAELAKLCDSCGRGFSYFKYSAGLIAKPITEYTDCTRQIKSGFDKLRMEQIKNNPINYFVRVPLSNLGKALFKFQAYGKKNLVLTWATSGLFLTRTLLIFAGLAGILMNRRSKLMNGQFLNMILVYFIIWYITLCFGYRNIEIRYFLPADVLLLIPACIPALSIILFLKNTGIRYSKKAFH